MLRRSSNRITARPVWLHSSTRRPSWDPPQTGAVSVLHGRRRRHVRPGGDPPFRLHWGQRRTATATIPGPFFRWLDSAPPSPQGYKYQLTLAGWASWGTNSNVKPAAAFQATTPDAALSSRAARWCWTNRRCGSWPWKPPTPTPRLRRRAPPAARSRPRRRQPLPGPGFTSRDSATDYKRNSPSRSTRMSYEVCLTTMLRRLDPWATYLKLRRRNPASFASFLRFGPLAAASTSPERFLRIASDGGIRAEPIKGTRRGC